MTEQLICYLIPGILITLFHIFKLFLLEEKYRFFEILSYYLKATIIINIVMIILVLIKTGDFVWNHDITNGFIIKYIVIGSVLGLFLPYCYYEFRIFKKKIIKNKE